MLTLLPRDGASAAVLAASGLPGCSDGYYRDLDWEEDQFDDRRHDQNASMRGAAQWTLTPWPEPMPPRIWVDWCSRYERDGNDGLAFTLHHRDTVVDDSTQCPVPAGEAGVSLSPDEWTTPEQGRARKQLHWTEVQERQGIDWYRMEFRNERGAPSVNEPLSLVFRGLRGGAYRLELEDQSLFTPFDLSLGADYYRACDADGNTLTVEETRRWLDLTERGVWAIYLRPRRWRWVARVLAHFVFITAFEIVQNDEWFLRSWYDTPPRYPYRHDVIETTKTADMPGYLGDQFSYDYAIDWAFDHARNAADLRTEIVSQQYSINMCSAYLLTGTEYPELALWRAAPRVGEYVCGLARIDTATGAEGPIVWMRMDRLPTGRWPLTLIGEYLILTWNVWE